LFFISILVDLQQARFAVRMMGAPGLGAEPMAHYTRALSKLASGAKPAGKNKRARTWLI
jgi:hypothetical protein